MSVSRAGGEHLPVGGTGPVEPNEGGSGCGEGRQCAKTPF